jgi:signal transduction histidine kinase/ActR/RegA family two-component response regulator
MTWQRVEGVPILVRVTMPRAALWLGMSRSGVSALAFALGLCTVMLLAARLVLVEVAKRNTLEAASAARLAVLAKLAADLQDVIQVREALALLVEAVQCLFPTGEVLAVFMPEDGAEEVVHSRRPGAPRPTSDDDPARPVWLSMPLRGDAGEYVGAIEVFGCDARSVAQEDHAALLQVAALGEATLRRARLLMHLSATAADAEAARAQLEQICDTIHDGFCALDRAGLFIYANAAAIRLLDPAGQPLAGRKLPEVLPGEAAPLAAALGGNRVHQGEVVLPGGQVATLRLVPIGKGFALFLRDMTMAREVERLRETTERLEALGVLTGGVAHDFNNLLTVVIGNAEMLVDSLNERPELAHSAGLILGAAERGAALIRRMMAFARRQPLSPAPTNVATLIEELVPLLRQSVGERVRLVLRLAPGLPYALVDPAQLEAALLNLAINARDAMPRGGTLRIELSEEALGAESLSDFHEAQPGRFLRLAVTDDGQGMAPEVAQRAFEPFFTTKSPGAGSGLGLASVYGFIRQSRGRIQLDSAPGRGTTVVLHLPHAPASVSPAPALAVSGGATEAEAAPGPDAAQARPSGTLHILLVEDEEALRLQIAAMLREMGHTVTVAAQGEAALAQLRQGLRPDVLLSDVVLPGGIDGAAVMREAQAILPELHVILMSGFAARLYDASGALPKGLRLLEKPFRRQALARRLEAVMEGRRKLPAPVQALS